MILLAILCVWTIASARADTLVAVRPGAMCAAADALARLTLPDGGDRADLPGHPEALAIKRAGGCIDVRPGMLVALQTARRNTSLVLYDAGDGRGERSFVVPNIDFASASGPVPAPLPGPPPPSAAPVASAASAAPVARGAVGPSAAPAASALPSLVDYPSAVVALLRQSPALMSDPSVAAYWASFRFGQAYDRVRGQEFALQPVLAQARADLAEAVAAARSGTVRILLPVRFGEYDFARSQFPVTLNIDRISLQKPCCGDPGVLPQAFELHVAGLGAVDGLPMPPDAAQALVAGRTRYGAVDRDIVLLLTIALDPSGISAPPGGQATASGTLRALDMLSGPRDPQLLYAYTEARLDQLRAQAQARDAAMAERAQQQQAAAQTEALQRQAQFERSQRLAQRDQDLAQLSAAPLSVRLASFILPGGEVAAAPLDDLRDARERALLSGEPIGVTMLVHAARRDGGRLVTAWPGHLTVLLPPGSPSGRGEDWYLVSGGLDVPPGNDLPPAMLRARLVYACARARCADAAQPDVIVDRHLAALGGAASP